MGKVKKKFLITGCGRSGTGYYASVLRQNGYDCGHEENINGLVIKTDFNAESSWFAVPHLNKINEDIYVIRTLRDPVDVVRSFYNLGFFNDDKFLKRRSYKNIIRHVKKIKPNKYTPIHNIALYYLEWNKLFDRNIKNKEHRTIIFENLLSLDKITINDCEFKLHNKIINDKKSKKSGRISKVYDISKDEVIQKLKECEMYDDLMDYYNKQKKL